MIKKLKEKLKKFFDDEKVSDVVDTIKFITIYGIMGMFVLLTIISILGIDFTITNYIRNYTILTITTFLFGSGSAYYLLLDISKFYAGMRLVNKR